MPIDLKTPHDALEKLLKDLQGVSLAELNALPVRRRGETKTAAAWIAALVTAEQELEEWCPDFDGERTFGIDLKPRQ